MLRIGKMADYGIVLLTHMARSSSEKSWNAKDLAEQARLPLPTVSKILKLLTRSGVLVSQRGAWGGYRLARLPEQISVREILFPFEGETHMTECAGGASHRCEIEGNCPVRGHWQQINAVVQQALKTLRLSDMALPLVTPRLGKVSAFQESPGATTVGGT